MNPIVSFVFERMIYCLAEGVVLVVAVWLLVRILSRKNSQTKFVLWFSALLAIALLPFLVMHWSTGTGDRVSAAALVTLPFAVALYFTVIWAIVATLGMARVLVGLVQLGKLRKSCDTVEPQRLGPELNQRLAEFRASRSVTVLSSRQAHVPTAIGFFKPAVVLPVWLAEEGPSEELTHIVLHELEHLRRRDDWTNLAQKILKALLFFHPGVWWIERQLSLEREMACDDAVLAQTGSPSGYARSLARVAEKGFLRRHMPLAQAAVNRIHQLSLRIARILEHNRPSGALSWKAAIPAVMALSLVCGLSVSSTDGLVNLQTEKSSLSTKSTTHDARTNVAGTIRGLTGPAEFRPASQNGKSQPPMAIQARHIQSPSRLTRNNTRKDQQLWPDAVLAGFEPANREAPKGSIDHQQYVLVVASGETVSRGPTGWRVQVWQLQFWVPAEQARKQAPRKT